MKGNDKQVEISKEHEKNLYVKQPILLGSRKVETLKQKLECLSPFTPYVCTVYWCAVLVEIFRGNLLV